LDIPLKRNFRIVISTLKVGFEHGKGEKGDCPPFSPSSISCFADFSSIAASMQSVAYYTKKRQDDAKFLSTRQENKELAK
jgi:hypothetical protein